MGLAILALVMQEDSRGLSVQRAATGMREGDPDGQGQRLRERGQTPSLPNLKMGTGVD